MFTIVLTYKFSSGWLQKSWNERKEFEGSHVSPLFEKYADRVRARFYDAEAFCARFTDFVIFETADLKQYYYLIEELRESPLVSQGWIFFVDIFIGLEDGHLAFEKEVLTGKRKSA